MSFEVQHEGDANQSNDANAPVAASIEPGITPNDTKLALRARQAALDVVLDGVSLMAAQARLTRFIDPAWWQQAFKMTEDEVAKLRAKLLEGASFEDIVFAAEETGESITALAERLGVDIERIADVFDRTDSHVAL